MSCGHPTRVVQRADRSVRRRLEVLEAAVQSRLALAGESVLDEPGERIEERLNAATLGASTGRATPFIHTPWVLGCWPVMIVDRDGMHTTDCG